MTEMEYQILLHKADQTIAAILRNERLSAYEKKMHLEASLVFDLINDLRAAKERIEELEDELDEAKRRGGLHVDPRSA